MNNQISPGQSTIIKTATGRGRTPVQSFGNHHQLNRPNQAQNCLVSSTTSTSSHDQSSSQRENINLQQVQTGQPLQHSQTKHPFAGGRRSVRSISASEVPGEFKDSNYTNEKGVGSESLASEISQHNFWKEPSLGAIAKLPGRVMKQQSFPLSFSSNTTNSSSSGTSHSQLSKSSNNFARTARSNSSKPSSPVKNHSGHRRNHSTSFEVFSASCEDAWDTKLEDVVYVDQASNADGGSGGGVGSANSSNVNMNLNANNNVSLGSDQKANQSSVAGLGSATASARNLSASSLKTAIGPVVNNALNKDQDSRIQTSTVSHASSSSSSNRAHGSTGGGGGGGLAIPGRATSAISTAGPTISRRQSEKEQPIKEDPKYVKLRKLLYEDEVVDLNQLRTIAWAGIPSEFRPLTWKLLLGYLPVAKSKREEALKRKRLEYDHLVNQYYLKRTSDDDTWRQIHIDIPRMQPLISIFKQKPVQDMFERILYIWSIRHPASGYVQGMNDLVTPFFVTYLSEFIPGISITTDLSPLESFQVESLTREVLQGVEADSFWSFSKLMDSIQNNYTTDQPGIQHLVRMLAKVMSRVDAQLHQHLERHNVQYLQFAFRWMNNLLIREIPLKCIIRLWDTYLSEGAVTASSSPCNSLAIGGSFSTDEAGANDFLANLGNSGTPFSFSFHLYVCAAFLRFWSKNLMMEKDFQGLILHLQNLPTLHWSEKEVRLLLADAYQLKHTFTPNHLKM